jgi:hypothetical protein
LEIHGQNVALDDFHIANEGKIHAQLRGQHAIKFDGNHSASPRDQQGSELAAAGPDFEHCPPRELAHRFDNAASRPLVNQKVLSQFGFRMATGARGGSLGHVDPPSPDV